MSAGIRFGYRNLEHTPEATFVVKQRGFVLICSIEKSDRTDSVEYDTGGSHQTTGYERRGAAYLMLNTWDRWLFLLNFYIRTN